MIKVGVENGVVEFQANGTGSELFKESAAILFSCVKNLSKECVLDSDEVFTIITSIARDAVNNLDGAYECEEVEVTEQELADAPDLDTPVQ